MSNKIKGVVSGTKVFDTKTRDGKAIRMHNFTVNGENYGTGRDNLAAEGDVVEFDVDSKVVNGKTYLNAKNLVNHGKQQPAQVSAPRTAQQAAQPQMSKEDWGVKDERIAWQAARNASIALVGHLLAKDLIPKPAREKNWPDAVEALSNIYTERFFRSSQTRSNTTTGTAQAHTTEEFQDDDISF